MFIELQELSNDNLVLEFLNSHPATLKRIERITSQATMKGELTLLPEFFVYSEDESVKRVEP